MLSLFAHAGEAHDSVSSSASHWLETWYVALPVFVLAVLGLATLMYLLSRQSVSVTILVVTATLLVAGVSLYDASPVISIFSITIGLAGTLLLVLTGLGKK